MGHPGAAALRRSGRLIRRHLIAAALAAALAASAQAADLSGAAVALDGDSLDLAGVAIRLHGIDAPEFDQPMGRAAHAALAALIAGRKVACTPVDVDRHHRIVATCRAGGTDLGQAMVGAGLAIAYRRYSTRYVAAEDEARQAARGLWAGPFIAPEDWRRRRNSPGE